MLVVDLGLNRAVVRHLLQLLQLRLHYLLVVFIQGFRLLDGSEVTLQNGHGRGLNLILWRGVFVLWKHWRLLNQRTLGCLVRLLIARLLIIFDEYSGWLRALRVVQSCCGLGVHVDS